MRVGAHRHLSFGRREFHGVGDKIEQDLLQRAFVAKQLGAAGGHFGVKDYAAGLSARGHQRQAVGDQHAQIDLGFVQGHAPGFDLRQIEDVVDQRQQVMAGIADES